ncbi:MAG: DNA repair protein RecN [Anaerolineae bacterium]|jgi:DNA repair protein RecN (Recombination protein N)|nr:DNA repair protein RecN [Anaerolineae bacterium]
MLEELRIQNFAIIDRLELDFAPGLNVITGETGAGKSIIIDAVELLLGGKADPAFIRSGSDKATVEGVFALRGFSKGLVLPLLRREDLVGEVGEDFVTLYREIRSTGRSVARVNGASVTLEVLREIGAGLVDIHGQSEHLSLLNSRYHLDLIDRYAELMGVREAIAKIVADVSVVRAEINTLQSDKRALERRAEQLRDDIADIEAAELDPAEEDDLKAERMRLSNSEQLATLAAQAVNLLSAENTGELPAVDRLQQVAQALAKLAAIDASLAEWAEVAEGMAAQAQDLAIDLADYAEAVEYNPKRLNFIEERLELINKLKRRYGGTVEQVLAYAERARDELDGLENSEERLEQLRAQEHALLVRVGELGMKISNQRQIAAKRLAKAVMAELGDLRMERARFEVGISQTEAAEGCIVGERRLAFDSTGLDAVEMLLSANPGEPLRPLAKVASGGEAARIMLALKRVLTAADHTPTLIFDEVDQGIGGRIGTVVGEKLWTLTHGHQVLVVTHLPQLAGFADKHYHVKKIASDDRTATQVTALDDPNARVIELAEMLGATGESGRQSARDLLSEAQARKSRVVS